MRARNGYKESNGSDNTAFKYHAESLLQEELVLLMEGLTIDVWQIAGDKGRTMKDYYNNEINIGDSVVMIYHPRSYEFALKMGKITELYGQNKKELRVMLNDESHEIKGFLPDETKERYPKLIKLDPHYALDDYVGAKDAIGQPIQAGDHIVCTKKIELGNTLKGFENGGIVTKVTDKTAFFESEGVINRRSLKWVVVVNSSRE